jgi:hypothetical protein
MTTKQTLLGCLMFVCGAVVASLAFAHPRQAVEHAPTVEQCRADRAYWMSKIEQPDGRGTADVSYDTLTEWHKEMRKCEVVDPENSDKYYNAMGESYAEQLSRMIDFLNRHNLWQQFDAEDAAGKR